MDDEDKHGVHAEIQLHASDAAQENTQPGESDTGLHRVSSTVSTHSEVPAGFPSYSIDYYNTLQDIKREAELPTEDDACGRQRHSVRVDVLTGLESLKFKEQGQAVKECDIILPFNKTDQETVWTGDNKDRIETKEDDADCSGYGGNSEVIRCWVVCAGGVLKEVEAGGGASTPKVHQEIGKGVQSFNCDTCGKSFVYASQLKRHKIAHASVKAFTCSLCGKSFAQSRHLKAHERTHTCLKPFTCGTCGKSFAKLSDLKVHKRSHTCVKPFICACGKSFIHSNSLKVHERTHSGENLLRCATCGKSFIKFGDLKTHCCRCGKSFATKNHLKLHERTHTCVTRFTCVTCGKSFIQSGDLKEHEIAHSGAKPFASACSGKSFAEAGRIEVSERTHASGLHIPVITHNGVQLFTCSKCEKSFTCSRTLNVHEQSHTTCATCGITFGNSEQLTFHEMTHTDIKLFACTKCGKSFEQSSRLKVHIITRCDTRGSHFHDIKR